MRTRILGRPQAQRSRAGMAILTVLLVLLALLVLCAPFLMTARNASRASGQLADAAQVRLALDSAAREARQIRSARALEREVEGALSDARLAVASSDWAVGEAAIEAMLGARESGGPFADHGAQEMHQASRCLDRFFEHGRNGPAEQILPALQLPDGRPHVQLEAHHRADRVAG